MSTELININIDFKESSIYEIKINTNKNDHEFDLNNDLTIYDINNINDYDMINN